MIAKYIGTLLALIVALAIYSLPIVGIVLLIRAISKRKTKKQEYHKPQTNRTKTKWYPSGWVLNEETQLWEPPDYLKNESKQKWEWNQEKGIWIDKEKEARLERYRKAHEGREPTYEEWKAERLKKELEATPQNTTTEKGTYRYDYIHTPSEQQQHFHHEDTTFKVAKEIRQVPKDEPKKDEPNSPYADAYEVTPLLTRNESRNYRTLQEAADMRGLRICPKVRLADIVKPRNDKKYMSHFGKIKSKHVDFAICDNNMKVLAVVELDDSSHDRKDRQERDEFVDGILKANGIKVIRTRYITHDILDNI